jgi:hypothetical protein
MNMLWGQSVESLIQTLIYTGFSNNRILMGYTKTIGPQILLAWGIPCPTNKNTD